MGQINWTELERAIAAAENSSDTALKEGVEMVYRQMCDAFTNRGITVIDRQGQPFDPNKHNAVMHVEDETVGEICDLIYHTLVMMVNENITIEDVEAVLAQRAEKAGNLKKFHKVDKNS